MKKRCKNSSAWLNAIGNSRPTSPQDVLRVMNIVRVSYEKLKAGHGSADDYDKLAAMVNVGVVRAESIGEALVDAFKDAGEAMLECARIYQRHGKYGFTGPHLLAMNAAVDLYAEILAMSSPNQMHAAALESTRRINRGEVVTP